MNKSGNWYWKSCCQQSIFSGFGNQLVTIWDTTLFLISNNDKLICMLYVTERGKFTRHNIFPYSCLCMKPMLSCSLTHLKGQTEYPIVFYIWGQSVKFNKKQQFQLFPKHAIVFFFTLLPGVAMQYVQYQQWSTTFN